MDLMKKFKQIVVFVFSTIVASVVCSAIMVFAISWTCDSFGIRFEQCNLWGSGLIFYMTLLLFPISFLTPAFVQQSKKMAKYFTWFINPMLFIVIYVVSLVVGLVYQLKQIGISKASALFDQPVAINFNLKMLSYFYLTGVVLSVLFEVLIIKLLCHKYKVIN